jgi:hypothetical protein
VLALIGDDFAQHCSAETHEAALELNTGAHATVGAAIAELRGLRARFARDARDMGLAAAVAGMHPAEMAEDRGSARRPLPARAPDQCAALLGASRPSRCTFTSVWRTPRARSGCSTTCAPISRCSSPCRPARRSGAAGRRGWPRTGRSSFGPSRARACRGTSRTTPTGCAPSTCSCARARSRSRPSSGGTCVRSPASAPLRCASWTHSRGSRPRARCARSCRRCRD